jgi:hypothetical protein
VHIPRHSFGGDVYADWIDANGAIVQKRHYQSRNSQFVLPRVANAVTLSVYVVDGRDGYTAAGGISLIEPPKPKPAPRRATVPARPRAADTITRLGFEVEDASP